MRVLLSTVLWTLTVCGEFMLLFQTWVHMHYWILDRDYGDDSPEMLTRALLAFTGVIILPIFTTWLLRQITRGTPGQGSKPGEEGKA